MTTLLRAICAGLLSLAMFGQSKTPTVSTVTPDSGRPSAEYLAAGQNLGKMEVKELFLTNGKDDVKTVIVEQKDDSIRFKAPGDTKPGRYSLMTLSGDGKRFIEQPVKLSIE